MHFSNPCKNTMSKELTLKAASKLSCHSSFSIFLSAFLLAKLHFFDAITRFFSGYKLVALVLLIICSNSLFAKVNNDSDLKSASLITEQPQWFALFLADKKAGYAKMSRVVQGQKVITTATTQMQINRGADNVLIESVEQSVETLSGQALSFNYSQQQGAYQQVIEGKIKDSAVLDLKITSAGQTSYQQQPWLADYALFERQRLQMIAAAKSKAQQFTSNAYMISAMQVIPTTTIIGDTGFIDLLGKVVKLTGQTQQFGFANSVTNIQSYWDADYNLQKMVWPMMGTTLQLVASTEQYALSDNQPSDFFTQGFTQSPVISIEQKKKGLVYQVLRQAESAKFITTAEQTVQTTNNDAELSVIVTPITDARGVYPYQGQDPNILPYLEADRWAQSDDAQLITLASKVVAGSQTSAQAAKMLEIFVRGYISEKNLSVGYASALEVLASKEGDCTEHAVLLVAMLKAVGIPARVATGLAYAESFADKENVFVPHAWAQAYIGKQWVSYDAALNGFDSTHITLGVGNADPLNFFNVLNTLGNFAIKQVSAATL